MAQRRASLTAERRYAELERVVGRNIALYCFCAVYNVPYFDVSDLNVETWGEYLETVSEEQGGFLNGATDIHEALSGELPEQERWEMLWGVGDEDRPYTERDYRRLDELFKTYSARLVALGGYDAQQEDTLRNCCKMRLLADRCLARGTKESVAMCTQLNKAIQTELSSEGLRKVDAMQQAEPKLDTFVSKLEKAGLLEQGKILPLEEVQMRLIEIMGMMNVPQSKKYPYTIDAADQMMYMIANNIYKNDDMPEIVEMPDDLRFDRNVARQFVNEPNRTEVDAYNRMGLVRNFATPRQTAEFEEEKKDEEEQAIQKIIPDVDPDKALQEEIMNLFFRGGED